jgi:dockerin type I repeat protein
MRIFTPLLLIALMAFNPLSAEGTREVAPNGSIVINGNTTTDIAALHINHPNYNNFAAFNGTDPQSRLYIHVVDPSTECLYLGFNWAHNNVTSPDPPRINFQYQIKDPNGNIVFGPVTVTPIEANIQTWAQGFTGPMQINGPSGYNATQVTSTMLKSQGWTGKGDYYIEFRDDENNDLLIDFWDITVADCSSPSPMPKTGRIWSYNWSFFAINDFNFPNRPFNGAFYVCAPDPDEEHSSFVTKIDFNQSGFRPAAFNVAFNSFGSFNTGNVNEDRKSVMNTNATQAEYAIFLNDPIDICGTATVGEISIQGVSRCNEGDYCIKFTTTKAGQVDLLLDFDGPDNMYTPGTADRVISKTVIADEVGKPTCIPWDGLDGLGNPLPENVGTQIPITLAFAQGIYHFPIYDAELMTNGFMIASIRPAAAVSLLFYDDSNISVSSLSGEPATQLTGCMPPCHRWTNYTMPNTPGFGNLHTINSWWFSQLIIRQDVFFLPAFYTCAIEGPNRFCSGGTSELSINPVVSPAGAESPQIFSTNWSGPGIVGDVTGSSITINEGGTYSVTTRWITNLGDTCETSCEYEVTVDPPKEDEIDTLIVQGETIEINGETFSEGGTFIQNLTTGEGCDSILTINIIMLSTVIHYDMNDCESNMDYGTHMDYSEFIPTYPQPLSCATIVADTLHRENPTMNKHSCTPGVNGTEGMCVGILPGCTYSPGNTVSVIIEVNIVPDPDTAVHLTGFSFYEKAPTEYVWINGPTGPNNYPTLYGLRVLKNGLEIFSSSGNATEQTWNQEVYEFLDNVDFLVKDPTTFRFELLSYCPVGNGATESVWDLDEVDIIASCASLSGFNKNISGRILTESGLVVPGVEVHLYDDGTFTNDITTTTASDGIYIFESNVPDTDYYVTAYKNDNHANGVNTLDLLIIQKHLLGIKAFTSPYQFIAADVNRSHSLSALDLVEIKRLLLGKYDRFPRNTSWRFGVANQSLDVDYPWLFNETFSIESLVDHITNADFTAIKIGDVNHDAIIGLTSNPVTPRGSEHVILKTENKALSAGTVVKLDITGENIIEMAGLQFGIALQNGRILEIQGGALEITDDQFHITPDGRLLLSWTNDDLVSVSSDRVLFSLVVMSDLDAMTGTQLVLQEDRLKPEVYVGEDLNVSPIELETTLKQEVIYENALLGNEPNPFDESTTIRFGLAHDAPVSFTYFNLSGQVIHSQKGEFSKGSNEIKVDAIDLKGNTGIIICRMQTDGFVATQKMVVVK